MTMTGEAPTPLRPRLDADAVMAKSASENFTVASLLLPRAIREHFLAVYGFARFVDDVGDLAPGDRSRQLDWVEAEIDRALAGKAEHPVFVRIGRTAGELGLGRQPFVELLAANRQDQIVDRYATYAELEAYCALSANPVGRLVLAVLGRSDDLAVHLSDQVCTGLQLVEHWQDVGEDYRAGRVYLPLEDLERFGVEVTELGGVRVSHAFRRLMAFEVGRARDLLHAGAPLVRLLSGSGRVAIAGFVGGGLAQLDAIERDAYDVLSHAVKASKAAMATRTAAVFLGRAHR
ncbi:MAG: squalene synthase HpnC [Acidimicrobiaceae bacterium]|jgi:squalene synthase HpnC|nr:squalene synthase HpnC [Acidimicrobiaceae bacterium]